MDVYNTKLFFVEDGQLRSLRLRKKRLGFTAPQIITDDNDTLISGLRRRVSAAVTGAKTELSNFYMSDRDARRRNARAAAEVAIKQVIVGTDTLPSSIQKEGEAALASYTRKAIEAVRGIGHQQFVDIVSRNLAQLLIYAREEVLGSSTLASAALPVGTRFLYNHNELSAYIVEEAPRVRTIIWDGDIFQLSFPYCIFVFKYKHDRYYETRFYFRNAPITSGNDRLFLPPLPDVSNHGVVCWPGDMVAPTGDPATICNSLQTSFWNSNFRTEHWGDRIGTPINKTQWKKITQIKPTDILTMNWVKATQTVNTWYTEDDVVGQMSKMHTHTHNLATRVGTAIGEMVLQQIKTEEVAVERDRFQGILLNAIKSAGIPQRLEDTLMANIEEIIKEKNPEKPERVLDNFERNVVKGIPSILRDL